MAAEGKNKQPYMIIQEKKGCGGKLDSYVIFVHYINDKMFKKSVCYT